MTINRSFFWLISLVILLLAAAFRLVGISYGDNVPCLALPHEDWLYDEPQVSSLYSWDVRPIFNENEEIMDNPLVRTVFPADETSGDNTLLFVRMLGAIVGVLAVALMMKFALLVRSHAWWLAGLFVAVGWWFIAADRWVIRFDFAVLAVAFSAIGLLRLHQNPERGRWLYTWLHIGGALSLLLIAPPLWWLALGLILIHRQFNWRVMAFLLAAGIIAVPALQSPIHWIEATQQPDIGVSAAAVWLGIAFILWYWEKFNPWLLAAGTALVLLIAGYSVLQMASLPRPTAPEWELVNALQAHIPDGAIVRLDEAAWHLHPVIACPRANPIQFEAQPQPLFRPYLPGVRREPQTPDYIVTVDQANLDSEDPDYEFSVGDYLIGRMVEIPNASDVLFGNYLRVMGYEVLTPELRPLEMLDVRLDFQFSADLDEEISIHSMFIHMIPPGQPGDQIINRSVSISEEMTGLIMPRGYALNQHIRAPIPPDTEPGTYDIIFGIFNAFTGERAESAQGNALLLGQVEILSP